MAERVVPSMAANGVRIAGLDELQAHLAALVADAATPFDAKLFDDVELQLTDENTPPLLPLLLPPVATILKTATQDPTPLLSLTVKLLSPLPFHAALALADPPSLCSALASPLPGANLLAVAVAHKAAASPGDVDTLARLPDVLALLLRAWLASPHTTVAERCARVLGDILETDCEVLPPTPSAAPQVNGAAAATSSFTDLIRRPRRTIPGHGTLWRALFHGEIYARAIVDLCTYSPGSDRPLRDVTVTQGRLLRMLPRLAALNIRAIASQPQPGVYPVPDFVSGTLPADLLPWAALALVDREDMLMHLNWIDFFETLVSVTRVTQSSSEAEAIVRALVCAATTSDSQLGDALKTLPDRTVEDEAEPLRQYIQRLLN